MKRLEYNRIPYGIIIYLLLLFLQIFLGKTGHYFANMIPYQQVDSYDIFVGISIHHIVQMIIAIVIIVVLGKLLKIDFYFQLGDVREGVKYLALFTATFAVISIALHIFMYVNKQLPNYAFPLDRRNIIGILGFQLFLSGPSEEVIFRALPITMLIYAFGKSVPIKGNVTLEVILASLLFSFAHTNWSFRPFFFDINYFQIFYAFILGIIQGVAYQRSKSILYPMLMHSFSNVLMVGMGYLFTALINIQN